LWTRLFVQNSLLVGYPAHWVCGSALEEDESALGVERQEVSCVGAAREHNSETGRSGAQQGEDAVIRAKEIVHRLAVNAEAIRALVQSISEEQAQWQPNPDTWSMKKIMEHLYNEERIDFRQHLKEMLNDPPQPWGAFHDEYVAAESCRQALDSFLAEREASIGWLEALESPDWEIASQAQFVNETITLSAGDVLVSWVDHDFLHLRQMIALLHAWYEKEAAPYSTEYAGGRW
jgi:hypothetical protein